MALLPAGELLRAADAGGYAIGAFNFSNLELLQAIISAAEAERAPVIVQASQSGLAYAGVECMAAMGRLAAQRASVPVALNLDHGREWTAVMACLRHGFTGVMVDGSHLSWAENVALVKRVVEVAHAMGVSVEAELGRIVGTEDYIRVDQKEELFTDPAEAARFVAETGVDALAVAVGTAHGVYRGEPKLDLDRLARIDELVPVPLVLHGGSGVPDEAIRAAVARGVRKINIDTDLRLAFTSAVREFLATHPEEFDPRKVLQPARERVQQVVRAKMRLFGCAGRARDLLPLV